ncbi:MAG: hypothetical protein AB8F95_16065 [Bacteroidia bacterium]
MKTFLTTISSFAIIAIMAFGSVAYASPSLDREPTSVEFLKGKVHRLSMNLEEVRFKLKDKTITKTEKRTLKHERRMLKRELSYHQDLLIHARNPGFVYTPYVNPYARFPYRTVRRRTPVVCPPNYRRPVVVVTPNRRRTQARTTRTNTPSPRRVVQPRQSTSRSASTTPPRPRRTSSTSNIPPSARKVLSKKRPR